MKQIILHDNQKFFRGDIQNFHSVLFDDNSWISVRIPHDFAIDQPFDFRNESGSQGYLPCGVGCYRLRLPGNRFLEGKRYFLVFDGIFMESRIWFNGHYLGERPYGYLGQKYEITEYISKEQDNVIAVRAEVKDPSSRWYTGCGICRNVYLAEHEKKMIPDDGIIITTPDAAKEKAAVNVRIDFSSKDSDCILNLKLISPEGIALNEKRVSHVCGQKNDVSFDVENPQLWSPETPDLYQMEVSVCDNSISDEKISVSFGIRSIEFTYHDGFHLNGNRYQIKGLCQHHDLGCLGGIAHSGGLRRQLAMLKKCGCNAIRTVHNPHSPQLLQLCDSMGFLVMNELFDEWKSPKKEFGYHRFFDEWSSKDTVDFVKRDRNHPCVILWSIGNEISEERAEDGGKIAQRLADLIRKEDGTRPVTAGYNQPDISWDNGFREALDVLGLNYAHTYFEKYHGKYKLYGSETTATLGTRGEYRFLQNGDAVEIVEKQTNHQESAYSLNPMEGALTPEQSVIVQKKHPWSAGEFAWCGFDYLGEPHHASDWSHLWTPARSSYWGMIDLAGFPKDVYYFYQSQWTKSLMAHLLPHWNWNKNMKIPVWCYSNADSAELFLNGKSQGIAKCYSGDTLHFQWEVNYEPGELKVIARRGNEEQTDCVITAGEPEKIILLRQAAPEVLEGEDRLCFVEIQIADSNGVSCPFADHMIRIRINGPAEIAGVDNGDPTNHESFRWFIHRAFHGKLLAVFRRTKQNQEKISVEFSSQKLENLTIDLDM